MRGGDGGSAAAAVIVMLPLLIIVCAGVIQLGALRVIAAKVNAAADLATLAAVADQDAASLASTGRLRLAPDAAAIARDYFARNLGPIEHQLLVSPARAAADADIVVFADAPATDPLTGARYDHPTVRLAARVPVSAPAFGVLLIQRRVVIDVRAVSAAR